MWTPTPTLVVLVTGCLSWRGLSCLGRRLQLLHWGRAGVELPDRGGPRKVLDHFNLYCKCRPSHQRRDGGKERTASRGINGQQREWRKGSNDRKQTEQKEKRRRLSEKQIRAEDATIVEDSWLLWLKNQQQLWTRKGRKTTGLKRK